MVIFVEIKTSNSKGIIDTPPIVSTTEAVTEKATEVVTQPETMPKNDFSGEAPKQPMVENKTEAVTEKATEKPTERATEKPTEKPTQPPAPAPSPTALPTEAPTSVPVVIEPPQQQPPATIYIVPVPSEDDIYINPNVIYINVGQQATISVVYPPGLSTHGESWDLENNAIVGFISANVGSATINAKSIGTTYLHAYPKGTNRTLTCTVIVQ